MRWSKAMANVIAVAVAILATTCAAAPQSRDFTGRWTGTFNGKGKPITLVLNLKSSGDEVTGMLVDPGGNQMPIQEWKLEGSQLTFEVLAKEHGHSRRDHWVGVVQDEAITLLQHGGRKYDPPITFHRDKE